MRLLVVEDNPRLSELVARGLREHGHAVDVAARGLDGEMMAAQTSYDAIVLDLMLPDRDGIEVCKSLRRRGNQAPILMLTAISGVHDTVACLNAGADDYLTKPFEFDELLARIRALLRRGRAETGDVLRAGDIEFNLSARTVSCGGQPLRLGPKETSILEYLMRNPDRVVTRVQIHEHVWDGNFDAESNVIDVHISGLRRKLTKANAGPVLRTVVGVGYMLATQPSPAST